jgi:hypothetical protein
MRWRRERVEETCMVMVVTKLKVMPYRSMMKPPKTAEPAQEA